MADPNQITLADLAFAQWMYEDEIARERAVVLARAYHDGDQMVYLTERMKTVLGSDAKFNLNLVRTVVEAVSEILILSEFESDDEKLSDWANAAWVANRMTEKHTDVHEGALRDGEYFVLVDWDNEKNQVRFSPHPRFTDSTVTLGSSESSDWAGDSYGIKAFYADDDDANQPMLYAAKRWIEYIDGAEGGLSTRTRQRMTLYYPDRIEKYARQSGNWEPITDPEDNDVWPLPWVDSAGKPMGIQVIHFRNPTLRCEAWDAIPIQRLLNKTLIDLLISADVTAFRIFVAMGFIPTSDGKAPSYNAKGEMENALVIEPGQIVGSTAKTSDASFTAIDPADPAGLLAIIEKAILWVAMVTGTPVSRFQLTGQVASADSQKEGSTPLYSKARNRQTRFGNSWRDVLAIARKIANTFGKTGLDETAEIDAVWKPLEPRDTMAELAEKEKFWTIVANVVAQTAGEISAEVVLRDLGWTDEQIAQSGIQQRVTQDVIPNVSQ